jgi:integrase
VRQIDRLSSAKVKNAKPGLHPDGGGLYLQVTISKNGHLNKSWVFRFARDGRERRMGLGSLNTFGLGEARERAAECRKRLEAGKDPIEERDAERTERKAPASESLTLEQCAIAYIAAHEAGWRNAKHRGQWRTSLRDFAYPVFGALPVDQIDTALVMEALAPLWADRIDTGTRVRARIEAILDWARVKGYRSGENPARWRGHLDHLLAKPSKAKRVVHHAAMPYADLPSFLVELRKVKTTAAWALELLVLTAARAAEVRGARWDEIDVKTRIWTIPGERMKRGKEHRVPLTEAALSILDNMRGADPVLVFPGARNGQPLGEITFWRLMRQMGIAEATPHGFRSAFKDWAAECTNSPDWVSEKALAHVVGDETRRAYQRGDLLEKRRKLMDDWAQYCANLAADNVVSLKPAHSR